MDFHRTPDPHPTLGAMLALALLPPLTLVGCTGDDASTPADGSSSGGSTAGSGSSGSPTTSGSVESTEGTTAMPPGTTTDEDTTTAMPPDSSGDSGDTGPPLEGDVLQNDSWTPADGLVWQTWPNDSDCWASVFDAMPAQYPFEIVGAIAAIGDQPGVFTFEIGVWEVSNQGMPTMEIDMRTVDIEGGSGNLTEIDLSGLAVPPVMNGEFALVMCHTEHMGEPSIAIDADGTVDPDRNWVYQQAMGDWVSSPDFFGIDGDFILRAVIMPM